MVLIYEAASDYLDRLCIAVRCYPAVGPDCGKYAPQHGRCDLHVQFRAEYRVLRFYDDGGPAGNYANSSDATTSIVTFVGPPGSTLQALFSAFGTEPGWDTLYVFDGASVAAPMIASANGAPISCTGSTAPGGWMGTGTPSNTATPGLVQSTGNSLTFQFCSDGSVPYPGWAARVTTSAVATDANLAMGLTASPDPVVAGASLTYVATLTNNGPDAAQDATITLNLPAGVNLVSATASGAGNCTGRSGGLHLAGHDSFWPSTDRHGRGGCPRRRGRSARCRCKRLLGNGRFQPE
ncbi:MAG: DUF11 domain-containing protein [Rhodanobacteraceae bacterium]|nr:DUF11 domain-containing protein [Rhodanobacteraceae bacterium]